MSSSRNIDIDWITIIMYVLLVGIGWLAIYTANFDEKHPEILDTSKSYGRQAIWIGICLFLGAALQLFDTKFFTAFAYPIYGFILFLLIFVFLFGAEISGSKSWFRLGFFNFQPSELAKFATCLALAKYLSTKDVDMQEKRVQLFATLIILLPVLLILLQGDPGTAIIFTALILVLYREGLSGGWLLLGFLVILLFVLSLIFPLPYVLVGLTALMLFILVYREGFQAQKVIFFLIPVLIAAAAMFYVSPAVFLLILLGLAILFFTLTINTKRFIFLVLTLLFTCSIYVKGVNYTFNEVLKQHHRNRIGVVLGTIEDKRGVGYNLNQSKIAIGSGGLWGKGFLQGTQNKGKFVPELTTDFIFCTIGEEFGFVGTLVLIGLFIGLLLRIIAVSERQRSPFTRIYGYGVASILFCHFAINISMTIGLMPVIGIPLPFISYGGSSLMGFTILLFILVKLDSERLMYLR